ncbi:PREDICTED: olfactory receptor 6M1-like [Nanorana parkeri]|uniref:olfactory receptor 6M1-like n=1 Tax=Nanorana parkeri TaxID=125878 RepID=UPI0008548212|nr:PREDICTED: olfactory receptor 6M1-like [Nanorana parkeri]
MADITERRGTEETGAAGLRAVGSKADNPRLSVGTPFRGTKHSFRMENSENMSIHFTDFILLGFSDVEWQCLPGIILIMYFLSVTGNMIIIFVVCTDRHLSSPMYFFIANLSFIEILYTSVTIPKLLVVLIGNNRIISFNGCITQFYFFFCFGSTECFLLAVMSYDRYTAICNPLLYNIIMSQPVCFYLVLACWMSSFFPNLIATLIIANLKFCGQNIHHFFCDLFPLLQLSCYNTNKLQTLNFFTASTILLFSFSLTLWTYIRIIMTILKTSSINSRFKAFSTCASHLTVVLIFFGTVAFVYLRPRVSGDFNLNKVQSVIYIVVTPVINPLIYSFRNKYIKMAIKSCWKNIVIFVK